MQNNNFGSDLDKIFAGVASIPQRVEQLRGAIDSIYWQVDEVFVYLNNYESIPDFLERDRITIFRSQDHGDLKDVGKFFALTQSQEGVMFTIDDDIIYPSNYVARMLTTLREADYKAVVGVHGVILPEHPKSFFDRKIYHFRNELNEVKPVSFLGTGTIAFHTKEIGLSLDVFDSYGMADIHFGIFLKNKKIPALAISRRKGWLIDMGDDDPELETLYDQTRSAPREHNTRIRAAAP